MNRTVLAFVAAALVASPVAAQDASANFDGFYAGFYAGASPAGNNPQYQAGVLAGGRIALSEAYLVGIEAQFERGNSHGYASWNGVFTEFQAGTTVGDNFFLFGSAGLGGIWQTDPFGDLDEEGFSGPETTFSAEVTVGFGAEFLVNEKVRVRAQVQRTGEDFEDLISESFSARANAAVLFAF